MKKRKENAVAERREEEILKTEDECWIL